MFTFYEWQKRFPEFHNALKKGKAPVDMEVENALLKRALGYDYEETVTELYGTDDKPKKHVRKIKKHMPPDTAAAFIWLKNRKPDKWRDKPVPEMADDDPLMKMLEKWSEDSKKETTP